MLPEGCSPKSDKPLNEGKHDPTKCLENGRFDNDCCALKGTAKCKDNYKFVETEKVCHDGGSWKAYSYKCEKKTTNTVKLNSPSTGGGTEDAAKTEGGKAEAGKTATNLKMFTDRECGVQGMNFGSMSTPEDCAIVARRERYQTFMFSTTQPSLKCRGCTSSDGGATNTNWNVYFVIGAQEQIVIDAVTQNSSSSSTKAIIEKYQKAAEAAKQKEDEAVKQIAVWAAKKENTKDVKEVKLV